jgi:hypothetical protein
MCAIKRAQKREKGSIMDIHWGQEYSGPGRADPAKTRAERQRELLELVRTAAGRDVIEYYFGKYTGVGERACPPAGLLMVQSVLGHEYPGG